MSSAPSPPNNDDVLVVGRNNESGNNKIIDSIDFENLTMDDVDEAGNAMVGVKGVTWDRFSAKQLRRICSHFGVRGYKNAKKCETIEIMKRWFFNKKVYSNAMDQYKQAASGPARKEVQCAFRLMNILFSDVFAADFATIGNIATREEMDSGKAGNEMYFWEQVQDAFVTPGDISTYNELQFVGDDGDDIFNSQHHINPGNIVVHDWKKLRAMWKTINAEYKAALSRFTVSGTHDSDFFGFCKGNLETYYLRLHLQRRPELNGMVEANLPDKCFVSSAMSMAELRAKGIGGASKDSSNGSGCAPSSSSNGHSSSSSSVGNEEDHGPTTASDVGRRPNKKRKVVKGAPGKGSSSTVTAAANSHDHAVAAAIRELGNSQMRAEVAKQKLLYMQEEASRRREKIRLNMWEKLQRNIRRLRKDLLEIVGSECQHEAARLEIEQQIKGLNKKRIELETELGIDSEE